jgi:hypothetical protein
MYKHFIVYLFVVASFVFSIGLKAQSATSTTISSESKKSILVFHSAQLTDSMQAAQISGFLLRNYENKVISVSTNYLQNTITIKFNTNTILPLDLLQILLSQGYSCWYISDGQKNWMDINGNLVQTAEKQ